MQASWHSALIRHHDFNYCWSIYIIQFEYVKGVNPGGVGYPPLIEADAKVMQHILHL